MKSATKIRVEMKKKFFTKKMEEEDEKEEEDNGVLVNGVPLH